MNEGRGGRNEQGKGWKELTRDGKGGMKKGSGREERARKRREE